MNFVVNTGSQQRDHEELTRYQQHYRAQGLEMYAQALPTGGYQVTIAPAQQPAAPAPQQYGAPAAQQYGAPAAPTPQYGAPAAQQYGARASAQVVCRHPIAQRSPRHHPLSENSPERW